MIGAKQTMDADIRTMLDFGLDTIGINVNIWRARSLNKTTEPGRKSMIKCGQKLNQTTLLLRT